MCGKLSKQNINTREHDVKWKKSVPLTCLSFLLSLTDFIFESARFQMPNVKDLDKWGYRVYNNLIYYQSNYFLMAVGLFVIIV